MAPDDLRREVGELHGALLEARDVAPVLPLWARMLYLRLLLELRNRGRELRAAIEELDAERD